MDPYRVRTYEAAANWHAGLIADEHGDPGQEAVEEIEGADGPDTDEVKQRAFDTQVREGLVQALINPVPTPVFGVCLHGKPLTLERLKGDGCGGVGETRLDAP